VKQVKEELERMYMLRDPMFNHFAFFHVGDDISQPQKMVKSLLRHNPDAFITMYTDYDTPDVMGVTARIECEVDKDNLMYSRVKAYAHKYDGFEPKMYLDTDMIVQGEIVVKDLLEPHKNAAFLRRDFQRDAIFNIEQRGIKFPEYEGKTLDQLYPYVGCAVVADGPGLWEDLLEIYEG
jgi:hypothetical protein